MACHIKRLKIIYLHVNYWVRIVNTLHGCVFYILAFTVLLVVRVWNMYQN